MVNFMAPYPDDQRYWVTSEGHVWSVRSKIWLKPGRASNGYVTVSIAGTSKCVQHLVAETFISRRPPGMYVLHKDGTRTNNRLNNLRYDTPSENLHDITRAGRRKLSATQVREIRQRRADGEKIKDLGAAFNIAHNQVSYICSRKQYDAVY